MVFVDDITAFVRRRNKVVAEMAKKMKRVSEEVEKKGHKLSANETGKEGKSKMIASCGFLKEELRQCSTEEGVTTADSVETLGVDLRKQESKGWGQKKNEEEEVQGEILDHQENKAFHKSYTKVVVKKLLRAGMVPARTWRVHAVGMARTERFKLRRQMAAAVGKKSTTSLSVFM